MSRSRSRQGSDRDEPALAAAQGAQSPAPKTRQEKPKRQNTPKAPPGAAKPWHPALRVLVSGLVVVHLTAVFVAPWALSTPPALPPDFRQVDQQGRLPPDPPPGHPVWQDRAVISLLYDGSGFLEGWLRGYMNLVFINHGYEFFAPDPGPSQLVRIRLFDRDNQPFHEVTLPDRNTQWPRLFYHRHMMLAAQSASPSMGPVNLHRQFALHLLRTHGGERAIVERAVHMLLSPEMVEAGHNINARDTFVDLPETFEVHARELDAPAGQTSQAETAIRIPGGGQ